MTTRIPPARSRAVVAVLVAGGLIVSMMQTVMVPLIPELPRLVHTSAASASWLITATLVTAAVATPILGRLGDLYGKRRMLVACALSVTAGSVLCATTSALIPLVIGRALQGLGISLIALGISIMRDVLPAGRLTAAVGLMSSSFGVGGALGLPTSAAIAQHLGWHALFWLTGGLATLFIALTMLVVPRSPISVRADERFDVRGAVALSAGLVAFLLAVSKGGEWGWASTTTLGLFGVAAVVLPVWGWWQLRAPSPMVDLHTSARGPVLLTNLAAVATGFAMYVTNLTAPQMLQLPKATGYGQGLSMLHAGLWMIPGGLSMMVMSQVAARLSAARGFKTCLVVGCVSMSGAELLGQALIGTTWGVALLMALVSTGVAFAYAAMPPLIMSTVPVSETAAANAVNSLCRSLGTSVASAAVGAVIGQLTMQVGGVAMPSETGIRIVLVLGALAGGIACLFAAAIPSRRRRSEPAGVPVPRPAAAPTPEVAQA